MNENNHRIFQMKEDELIPEGVYLASLMSVDSIKDLLRFNFQILDPEYQGKIVSGITDEQLTPSSKLYRWLNVLGQIELNPGDEISFEDLKSKVAGSHCFIKVTHRSQDDTTYANVTHCYAHNDPRFINQH